MNLRADVALMLVVGVVPLVFAGWCWAGRSRAARWWVGGRISERLVRLIIPGWGLMVTPAAVKALFEGTPHERIAHDVLLWLICPGIVLCWWGLFFLPIPRWWAPRWFRRLTAAERRPNVHVPLPALAVGYGGEPVPRSSDEAARVFAGSRRVGSWQSSYVYDPDSDEQDHALAPKGAVAGRLTVYEAGLVFAASGVEDNLRGQPTVLAIDAADITGVRVVPARAGADGVRRRGLLYRSMFPRLVVDTGNASHVFDLVRSARVAEQVRSVLRQRR